MAETVRLVVTVMAYPAISMKHGESVCVAGVRTDTLMESSWIRLFPFRVRDLPIDARIHKWDEIEVNVVKARSDHRPESFTPNLDSVRVVGHLDTSKSWIKRRAVVDPLALFDTMLGVEQRQTSDGLSLAAVRTGEILDLEVTPRPSGEVTAEAERAQREAAQGSLFSLSDKQPLEPVPFNFHYVVRYHDEPEPRRLKVIDWEINQAWRNWRRSYPDPEVRVREKWLNELCGPTKAPLFFVGNMHRFQEQLLLLSVYWPPRLT